MPFLKEDTRATYHISFTPEEKALLRERADRAGLEIVPFIKKEALHGEVKGFVFEPLLWHEDTLGEIVHKIRKVTETPNPNRWLYEADLELIETQMAELISIEKNILNSLCRKMR